MSARRTIQRDKSWAPVTFGLISPAGQPAARVQQWPHPIQGRGIGDLLYRIARKSRIAILRARVLAQRGLGKASQALGGSSGIRFGSNNLEDFETVPTSFPGLQEMLDGHGVPYLTLPQSYLARLAPLLDPSRLRAIFCPSLWRMTIQERDVLTNYVENGGILIAFGEQGRWLEGRERDEMALARVFGLQRVAAGRAPAFAKIRFLEHPITRGFPLISEEPHLDLIVPLDLKAFRRGQEYTTRYTADGGTALARARPLDDERAGEDLGFDYIALGQYGSGHTLWFHEGPGFSLFLRYAIATRKGSDGGRTIPTGTSLEADDLEPVIWRIVNNFLRQLDIPMVSLGVSPSRYSFSVAHDTEDLSCLKAAVRIKELDDTCGIEGTWYLRTQVEEGQYPHHPFYYEQKPYSLEEAARCLGEASVGLHGEGYTWISENLSPSLEPGETYSAARSAIRAAFPGAQVRSGSTHLGNYVEKYPQEYEALRDAGFRLWRNSYKFNGLTAMRPYAFYRPDGKAIHGIWGYCDAFTDDIAGADFERGNSVGHPGEVIRQKWEKAIRWLAVVGEGNLFLHCHPHNYDDLPHGEESYRATYRRALEAGLINVSNEEIISYWGRKEQVRLETFQRTGETKVVVSGAYPGLIIRFNGDGPLSLIDESGAELPTALQVRDGATYMTIMK